MKRFYIILFAVIFVITGSCTQWLELEPYDGVMEESYWNTKEDVNSFLIGCYTSLTDRNLMERIILWGELRSDFFTVSANAQTHHINIVRGEINPDNSVVMWKQFYYTINQCNKLIEKSALTREKDKTFTNDLYRRYLAEATAIRSLMYFYLVRSFRDVPLVLKATDSDAQDFYPPKTEGSVILDTLVVHMKEAIKHLPPHYRNNDESKGRMTCYAGMALLADIHLWQGNYAACEENCNLILGSGQFSLIPVNREEMPVTDLMSGAVIDTVYYPNANDADYLFDQLYVKGNCIESIFEAQFPKYEPMLSDPFFDLFNNNGYVRLYANLDNLDNYIFPPNQYDKSAADIRGRDFSFKSGTNYVWKLLGFDRGEQMRSQREFPHWIFYRLSDVILMKAEALNQIAITTRDDKMMEESYKLVMQIRTRANAVKTPDVVLLPAPIDGKALEMLILNERAREFAFEGKRWYDLLRFAKRDNYAGINYLTNMAIVSAPPDKLASLQTKYENHWFHYWPIHISDVETNPQLRQNDFYLNFKR